jgi:hypothetical protein
MELTSVYDVTKIKGQDYITCGNLIVISKYTNRTLRVNVYNTDDPDSEPYLNFVIQTDYQIAPVAISEQYIIYGSFTYNIILIDMYTKTFSRIKICKCESINKHRSCYILPKIINNIIYYFKNKKLWAYCIDTGIVNTEYTDGLSTNIYSIGMFNDKICVIFRYFNPQLNFDFMIWKVIVYGLSTI